MIIETTITKEAVEGGINVTTTTVEFIPQDVLDSRAILLDEQIADLQSKKDELTNDLNSIAQSVPEPTPVIINNGQ